MFLDVGNGHNIHFEEYGNPKGIKILFLHGGPGLGFSENDKAFFDPEKIHVVFIDQRGCGKSTPKGSTSQNTTQDLVSDIDLVLSYLEIESLIVFGGSWGATLAILFAAAFPHRVSKMILRGFFSATKKTTDIYLRGGIKSTHPKSWERVSSFAPLSAQDSVAMFYFKSITFDTTEPDTLAYEWSRYGLSLSRKHFAENEVDQILASGEIDKARIRIELNYALNRFFIPEGYVFDQAKKIKHISTVIIHGKYDYICPLEDAQKLSSIIINSKITIVDGGHSVAEKKIKEALMNELNQL